MVVAEFGRWNGGLAPRLVGGYLDLLNFGDLCDYDLTLLIITHDI